MAQWIRHTKKWDYRYPGKRAMKSFKAGDVTYEPDALAEYAIEWGYAEPTNGAGRNGNGKAGKRVRRVA